MSEFVTRAENQRRLILIVACVIADTIALAAGIYAFKRGSDLEKSDKAVEIENKSYESLAVMRPKLDRLEQQNRAEERNLVEFAQPVGWRIHAGGTTDRLGTGALHHRQLNAFLQEWSAQLRGRAPAAGETESMKFALLRRVRELKDAAGRQKAVAVSETDRTSLEVFTNALNEALVGLDTAEEPVGLTLKKLFEELEKLENAADSIAKALEARLVDAKQVESAAAAEAEKSLETATKKLYDTIDQLLGGGRDSKSVKAVLDPDGLLKDLREEESKVPAELAKNEVELAKKLADFAEQDRRNRQFRAENEARIKDLQTRINWFKHRREEAGERREPDGEILGVVGERQVAYINLLHQDRLFRGTKFHVYSLEKGGIKIDKGEVEVIEVREAGSSVVAITRVYDPSDPIKTGDRIYNELYEKGTPRYIAFAGRLTGRLSNDEAASLIRKFGDVYQEQVDEKTSYVVVGDGYENHPNFSQARELGVKILLERSLYDYLGAK